MLYSGRAIEGWRDSRNAGAEFFKFIRTDGWSPTLRYVRNGLTTGTGIRAARTLFYRFDGMSRGPAELRVPVGARISRIGKREEAMGFTRNERLVRLPMERMFSEGALCFVLHEGETLIGFAWLQQKNFRISVRREFHLAMGEWHLGPSYVHRAARGCGWNKLLVAARLNYLKSTGAQGAFTCTNAENVASVRCLVGGGMRVIGETSVRRIGSREIAFRLIDFTAEYALRNRIQNIE